MTHYLDLAPCDYFGAEYAGAFVAVGWLAPDRDYPKGRLTRREHDSLVSLSQRPCSLVSTRGYYNCEMRRPTFPLLGCDVDLSTNDLFLPYGSRVLVAPGGVLHYVEVHDYLPPEEFRRAVLECALMASTAYVAALLRTDWAPIARKELHPGSTLEALLDRQHRWYFQPSKSNQNPLGDASIQDQDTIPLTATKVAKVIFAFVGLLFLIAGLLPALRGQPANTSFLSDAVLFLVLALALRPRRQPPPPGQGA